MSISSVHIKRLALAIFILILGVFALSTFYYKSLVLEPSAVLRGANMSVRSVFAKEEGRVLPNLASIKQISERIESGDLVQQAGSFEQLSSNVYNEHQLKNQLASNKARQQQLESDLSRLRAVNEQLLNSKATLDALDQDFSNVAVYQQAELARQQALQEALESDAQVPTEAEAAKLLSQRGRSSSKLVAGIPEKVLNNVQQTTGISPEEINEIMNT